MKDEHLSLLDSGHPCIQGVPKALDDRLATILGPIGESPRLAPGMPARVGAGQQAGKSPPRAWAPVVRQSVPDAGQRSAGSRFAAIWCCQVRALVVTTGVALLTTTRLEGHSPNYVSYP
jgi:hypothetical protein